MPFNFVLNTFIGIMHLPLVLNVNFNHIFMFYNGKLTFFNWPCCSYVRRFVKRHKSYKPIPKSLNPIRVKEFEKQSRKGN